MTFHSRVVGGALQWGWNTIWRQACPYVDLDAEQTGSRQRAASCVLVDTISNRMELSRGTEHEYRYLLQGAVKDNKEYICC